MSIRVGESRSGALQLLTVRKARPVAGFVGWCSVGAGTTELAKKESVHGCVRR